MFTAKAELFPGLALYCKERPTPVLPGYWPERPFSRKGDVHSLVAIFKHRHRLCENKL